MNEFIAIIPARAGSKGIINKNIIDFCGKPLIAWSIEQAMASKYIADVFVSTDGEEIAEVGESFGAKIIWRPKELATDTSTSEEAIIHAVNTIEKTICFDRVLFMQATSPVRISQDIAGAVRTFEEEALDSLFSMTILEDYCIWKNGKEGLNSWTYNYKERGRRQEREPLYLENGSLYLFKTAVLKKYKNRLGGKIGMYHMPFDRSFEIDSLKDIKVCENFMKKYLEEIKHKSAVQE